MTNTNKLIGDLISRSDFLDDVNYQSVVEAINSIPAVNSINTLNVTVPSHREYPEEITISLPVASQGEAIYQYHVSKNSQWLDISKKDYDVNLYSKKRIVYLAPPQVNEALEKAIEVVILKMHRLGATGSRVQIEVVESIRALKG